MGVLQSPQHPSFHQNFYGLLLSCGLYEQREPSGLLTITFSAFGVQLVVVSVVK